MRTPTAAGILPVDKTPGPTSHDVVDRARRALGVRRIGHTGTLDPFASGLLLLCVGPATRLSEYLTDLDKTYLATARLGVVTETDDPEGVWIRESEEWRTLDAVRIGEALQAFRGTLRQRPPAYSAKKVGGQRAYRLARDGVDVDLEPVEVEVHDVELLAVDLPEVRIRLRCSSGTYVRALARDLGEALGVGAHLTALRRTRIGLFSVEQSVPDDALDDGALVAEAWVPSGRALGHLPSVEAEEDDVRRLTHGQAIELAGRGPVEHPGGPVAVVRGGELIAVTERLGDQLRPRKVFTRG